MSLSGLILATGPGSTLDARIMYTPGEAMAYLGGLDSLAQVRYQRAEVIDLVLIVCYSYFGWSLWRFHAITGLRRYLVLLPGLLDLVETFGVLAYLAFISPDSSSDLATVLAVTTPAKWGTGLGVILYFGWHYAMRRRAS